MLLGLLSLFKTTLSLLILQGRAPEDGRRRTAEAVFGCFQLLEKQKVLPQLQAVSYSGLLKKLNKEGLKCTLFAKKKVCKGYLCQDTGN